MVLRILSGLAVFSLRVEPLLTMPIMHMFNPYKNQFIGSGTPGPTLCHVTKRVLTKPRSPQSLGGGGGRWWCQNVDTCKSDRHGSIFGFK